MTLGAHCYRRRSELASRPGWRGGDIAAHSPATRVPPGLSRTAAFPPAAASAQILISRQGAQRLI